jgi:glycosyltransferase involved in cell wall biosynthesis
MLPADHDQDVMPKPSQSILVIGPVPPPYHGVATYTRALFSSDLAGEFDLHHLDTSDRRGLDNFGVLDFGNVSLAFKHISQLLRFCLHGKFTVIYLPLSQNTLGFFRDACFIWISRLISQAKIIVHFHGSDTFLDFYDQTNAFMKRFIPLTLRQIDVMIVLGERLKHIFSGKVRAVQVVHNGTSFFPPVDGKFERPLSAQIRVSFLGRLCRGKGVLDLIHAVPTVLEKHPDVLFRFAGAWRAREEETRIEALRFISEHGLEGSIEFPGTITGAEKTRFFLETDIFVFPSSMDAFPMVILEAMAAGCPVISTGDVGAIPEVVIDGQTGILVEKQRPGQIAAALLQLIEDPQLRIAMGTAARERIERHFTLKQSIAKLEKVFQISACPPP